VGNKIILNMVSSVIATSLTFMISPNNTAGQLISGISKLIPDILESYLEKTQVEEKLIRIFRNSILEALSGAELEIDIFIKERIADEIVSGKRDWSNLTDILTESFEKYDVWFADGYSCKAEKIADDISARMNSKLVNDKQLSEFLNFVRLDFLTKKVDELYKKLDLNEQDALLLFRDHHYQSKADETVNFSLFPELKFLEENRTISGEPFASPLSVYFKRNYCCIENENQFLCPSRILLLGSGGTGKTTALHDLLCSLLDEGMFAVYIPLPVISTYYSVFDYISDTIFLRNRQKAGLFFERYGNSRQMVYLLDGYNEVSEENQGAVNRQLQELFTENVHIVISSRVRLSYALERNVTATLIIQPLERKNIISCMSEGQLEFPDKKEELLNILDTPLMLVLYTQMKNRYQEFFQLPEWNKKNTKAAVIWNFFQCEYLKAVQEDSTQGESLLWYVVYYVIPYIAWKMVSLESFYIKSVTELNEWVTECILLKKYQTRKGSLVNDFYDISNDKVDSVKIIKILSGLLIPVSFGEHKGYGFRHQNFRDCLAAIHCLNMIVPQSGKTPEAWKDYVLPEEILQYINELDEADRVEELWRRTGDGREMKDSGYTIYNIVEFFKVKYKYDLSGISFAGQDLRGISLNGVKLCSKLHSADFRKAWIAESTLLPQGHKSFINCIAVTSDGKYVVSGSQDGTIIKWDLRTGNVAGGPWHVEGDVRAIAIAPDNTYILWGGNQPIIHKWDLETGKELCEPWRPWKKEEENFVSRIYMTVDGQFAFVSGIHGHGILLNADTGESAGGVPELVSGRLGKVIFTPDNRYAVSSNLSGDLFKWEFLTGELVWAKKNAGMFDYLELTMDGSHLVCLVGEDICRVWDIDTGNISYEYKLLFECESKTMVLTPDGMYAIICPDHYTPVKIDLITGKQIGALWERMPDRLIELVITPDGRFVIGVTYNNEIYKWDTSTGELVGQIWRLWNASVTDIAVSKSGEFFYSAAEDGLVSKWEVKTGRPLWVSEKEHKGAVACIRLTSDEKYLLSGSEDGTIIKWNTDWGIPEGDAWYEKSETGAVRTLDITSDTKYVISGSDDGNFRKWEFATGKKVGGPWDGYFNKQNNVRISRDDKYFFCGYATFYLRSPEVDYISVWDINTGEIICPKYHSYIPGYARITLSSNENTVFGGVPNGSLFKGNTSPVQNYMEVKKFGYGVHLSKITGIALTSNDSCIYCSVSNGEIGRWQTYGLFSEIFVNIHPDFPTCLDIFMDNSKLIAGCSDGTIRIWDLGTKELLRVFRRIPNCNICGCQFQGALFENKELQSFVNASGGKTDFQKNRE